MIIKFDKYNESIEPIIDDLIVDDEFENELTDREVWDLEKRSTGTIFTEKELNKINLYFGIYKPKSEGIGIYLFDKKFGTFGTPITKLKGEIRKKREFDNKGERELNTYFLLDMFMYVSVGPTKGNKHYVLKFNSLEEVLDFFNSFER